jgi:hypothetical protein
VRSPTATHRAVLGLGLVTLALVPVAIWALFSGLKPYDDEGTMLVTLAGLSTRGAPYTDFYSQYGPFWLEVLGGPFALLGRPVTNDAGRIVVLVIWLATAALTGVAVRVLTGRLVLALAAVLCAFEVLKALADEPMHPSSLVALLLAGALVAALAHRHRARTALAVLGAITAALALTKINVGGLLLVALLYGLAVSYAARPRTQLAAGAVLVLLPVAVLAPDLGHRAQLTQCAVTVAGLLAVAAAGLLARTRGEDAVRRPLVWLAVGGLAVALPVLALPLCLGTSPGDLLEGVLVAPTRQRTAFAVPLALAGWALPWAVACLLLAVIVRARGAVASPLAALARLAAGGLIWATLLSALPGVDAGEIIGVVVPLAWVAALPPHPPGTALARTFLPAAAIAETLQAYPVAGTQVWIGLLLFVPVGAVCIGDGVAQLRALAEQGQPMPSGKTLGALAAGALLFLTATTVARRGSDLHDLYASSPRLGLPGAARLHAPPDQVAADRSVVLQLRRRCSALITLPGMHSFDLWSGIEAPSGFNTTHWWSLLTREQQLETVERARTRPRVCVLRNDEMVDWWSRHAPAPSRRSPLVRYIDDDFRPTFSAGPYRLLERSGA